jgi:hypothetical protein
MRSRPGKANKITGVRTLTRECVTRYGHQIGGPRARLRYSSKVFGARRTPIGARPSLSGLNRQNVPSSRTALSSADISKRVRCSFLSLLSEAEQLGHSI